MKLKKINDRYLVSIEPNEEIISTLVVIAKGENIAAATFTAIGAVSSVELGYYELSEKAYHWKTYDGTIEIVSSTGNIAWRGDDPIVHLHGVFSGQDFNAFAGHVKSAVVSAACEIAMVTYPERLAREYDTVTGLNLWKL